MASILEIKEAASGVARDNAWVTDPEDNSIRRALLIEESRENTFLHSEEFDHSDWQKSGPTPVTADDAQAPDGAVTADLIGDEDDTSQQERKQEVVYGGDTLSRVMSLFLRREVGGPIFSWQAVLSDATATPHFFQQIDPETGATDWADDQPEVFDVDGPYEISDGAEWYRPWQRYPRDGTGTKVRAHAVPAYNNPGGILTGSGDPAALGDAHVWGAQLTIGQFPTSYIPTVDTAVTREADDVAIDWAGGAPALCTWLYEFVPEFDPADPDDEYYLFDLSTDGAAPRLRLFLTVGGKWRVVHNNGSNPDVGSDNGVEKFEAVERLDKIQIRVVLFADGSVQLHYAYNGGAEHSAGQSGAPADGLAADWGATPQVNLGSRRDGGAIWAKHSGIYVLKVRCQSGNNDLATMESAAGDLFSYDPGDSLTTFNRASIGTYPYLTLAVTTGQAIEIDSALGVSSSKSVPVDQATESDTAQAVTPVEIVAVGRAIESDSAFALTISKSASVARATESDSAPAISSSKSVPVVQATETDTASTVTRVTTVSVVRAVESDSAFAISWTRSQSVGVAQEADSAPAVADQKTVVVERASEVDSAEMISVAKQKAVGQAVEVDSALAITIATFRTTALTVEVDRVVDLTAEIDRIVDLEGSI